MCFPPTVRRSSFRLFPWTTLSRNPALFIIPGRPWVRSIKTSNSSRKRSSLPRTQILWRYVLKMKNNGENSNMAREASVERNTKETEIKLKLVLDGIGYSDIETGVGFFDHMLDGFTRHGLFDLCVRVHVDLHVDDHHTVEDTGIVLGNAIRMAAGDKKGIRRYGSCILPMDEVLVLCAVDLCGRPYFSWDGEFPTEKIGDMASEMVREFF